LGLRIEETNAAAKGTWTKAAQSKDS